MAFWHSREQGLGGCYFRTWALTFLLLRNQELLNHAWLSVAISGVSVVLAGEEGGKENFLKVSLLAEKGKLLPWIFHVKFHNCQPNHQAVYPYALLFETFYSFPFPDSNSLQGFITFT